MKTLATILLMALGFVQNSWSQDIIYKFSGEEIKAKVVEISLTHVLFKRPEQQNDSIFSLKRAEVFMVKYSNGEKELLNITPEETTTYVKSPMEMVQQGRRDASNHYTGNGAMGLSILYPPAALVVAFIPPGVSVKNVPDPTLLTNTHYIKGYRTQAHRMKVGKAALGAVIGFLAYGLIAASSSN